MEEQKLVIATPLLQELVSKAVKVCTFTPEFPVTGALKIVCKDNVIKVISTDNINILELVKAGVEGNLEVVVDANLFSALVAKLTTPLTQLSLSGNTLTVKANGEYPIAILAEADGTTVDMPVIEFNESVNANHVDMLQLKSVLTTNKSCKAEMKEMPALFDYYMDNERVLTTDFYKACINPVKFFDAPVCLPPVLVDLIPLAADETGVNVKANEGTVLFESSAGKLFGRKAVAEDLNNYPATSLVEAFDEKLDYVCVINRSLLVNALERACLFTGGLDTNAINLIFDKEQLTIKAKDVNTVESIKYLQPSNIDTDKFECEIDGIFLKAQLNAVSKEDITIKFGADSGIQIVADKIIQSLSLLEESAEE